MGASFPLIVRAALGSRDDGGRAIGLLYAINTLGAVVGTLAAGFYLIGEIGIRGSIGVAAALNLAAGLAALLVGQRLAPDTDRVAEHPPVATASLTCPPALVRLLPGSSASPASARSPTRSSGPACWSSSWRPPPTPSPSC